MVTVLAASAFVLQRSFSCCEKVSGAGDGEREGLCTCAKGLGISSPPGREFQSEMEPEEIKQKGSCLCPQKNKT